jgi:FKBP-type peptidyl-prolyl cis-trans isomerase 2
MVRIEKVKNVTIRYSLIGKTLVFKINVVGSSPTTSDSTHSSVVERLFDKQKVVGSIPTGCT